MSRKVWALNDKIKQDELNKVVSQMISDAATASRPTTTLHEGMPFYDTTLRQLELCIGTTASDWKTALTFPGGIATVAAAGTASVVTTAGTAHYAANTNVATTAGTAYYATSTGSAGHLTGVTKFTGGYLAFQATDWLGRFDVTHGMPTAPTTAIVQIADASYTPLAFVQIRTLGATTLACTAIRRSNGQNIPNNNFNMWWMAAYIT